jgi:glycosyltransferase involved in cell wall biosynthesis
MLQPTFSVLSSAVGNEAHVAEMIDSVVGQTDPDWELIVVDGTVSDRGSAEVASAVAGRHDQRITLLHRPGVDLGGAVDAAADMATGRYYAVVHGDDRLTPEFCARTRAIMDAEPGIDAVVVDAYPYVGDDLQPPSFRQRAGITVEPGVDRRLKLIDMVRGEALYYTAAIRSDAWKVGAGYHGDTPKVEDVAMFLRLLASGCDVRTLPEQLAQYRLHADIASGRRNDQDEYENSVEQAFVDVRGLTDDPEVINALDGRLRALRYERATRLAREALRASDAVTARRQTWLALRERRSAKLAAVYLGLLVFPALLRHGHAAKDVLRRAVSSVRGGRRPRG